MDYTVFISDLYCISNGDTKSGISHYSFSKIDIENTIFVSFCKAKNCANTVLFDAVNTVSDIGRYQLIPTQP